MQSYRVLILGDSYVSRRNRTRSDYLTELNRLKRPTAHLRKFAAECDAFVLNLQEDLGASGAVSAIAQRTSYAPKDHAPDTVELLQALGVSAVNLANEDTLKNGRARLDSTIRALTDAGIQWFGAGRTPDEGAAPLQLALPESVGGGVINFHGSLERDQHSDYEACDESSEEPVRYSPLSVGEVASARSPRTQVDSLHIAYPHWGPRYEWRSTTQYELAHRFLKKDYDLVLGHGGKSAQEISRKQGRWVVYGIGDGFHLTNGVQDGYQHIEGILTCSLWCILEVQRRGDERQVKLKLYPVHSRQPVNSPQARSVSTQEFQQIVNTLASQPARPWRFDNPAQTIGKDSLGNFLDLDLGTWEIGQKPNRLNGPAHDGDPADWPLRSPSTDLEDKVFGLRKHLGAAVLSLTAESLGGRTDWLSSRVGVVECQGARVLLRGYDGDESPLSAIIVQDKVLTGELLAAASVPTPRTVEVDSAEAAVHAVSSFNGSAVIKPADGNKSKGVSTDIQEPTEIRKAYAYAREHGSRVIVQEYIQSIEELRVMASDKQAVAVNARALPHVIGDGISTVKQLIRDKNLQRTLNPSLAGRPIPIDELTERQLQRLGLSTASVPTLGQKVIVRNVAGLSVGGDTIQALDSTSTEIKDVAVAAVSAIPGLRWGGVDIMIEKDSARPYVIEVNTQAAYGAALFPAYGDPRDVGADVWNLRLSSAIPEPLSSPQSPAPREAPVRVSDRAFGVANGSLVHISELITDYLRRHEWVIEEKNALIRRITSRTGSSAWITKNGQTDADRAIARHVVKNHRWVLQLLDMRQIPRARSRTVSSISQLRKFLETPVSRVLIKPTDTLSWTDSYSDLFTMDEAKKIQSIPERMHVQARFQGSRLRVLSSSSKAYMISSRSYSHSLTEETLSAASELAVQAVRAIPELRWAAVDILVRQKRLQDGRGGGLIVEGMTLVPRFAEQDCVIAGSVDEFFEYLIPSASR